MPLRLIECALPKDAASRVADDLDESTVLGVWCVDLGDGKQLLRILASAERTEELVERLRDDLSFDNDSRIFLTEVLATVPKPEEDNGDNGDGSGADGGEGSEDEEEDDPPERVAAIELSTKLRDDVQLSVNTMMMVAMSAIVAAVGLITDDLAIVVGAMVIAPLLSPNMALALATTLGDQALLKTAGKAAVATVALAAALSFGIGLVIPIDPDVSTLAGRAEIGPGDVVLALAAGVAGALAFTTGVSEGIVGVMVAVALLPALVASGLLAGAGEYVMAGKAALLFVSNVVGVNLAAVGTFLSRGLRPNFVWEEDQKEAKRGIVAGIALWTILLGLVVAAIAYIRLG
jgi:uncharacterized hydrophobic protein (TIGR00341 family)